MELAVRILRKAIQIWTRLTERVEQRLKKEECLAEDGAVLHRESRIWNFRKDKNMISIGKSSHLRGELVVFSHGGKIQIGEASYVGQDSRIWSAASIMIGSRVLISHGVNIHDNNSHSLSAHSRHSHFMQIISSGHPAELDDIPSAGIVIEDDAWIGFNAAVLKGVRIGKGAVVGACSVVTKDVAAYTIVAGNPAQVIGVARP